MSIPLKSLQLDIENGRGAVIRSNDRREYGAWKTRVYKISPASRKRISLLGYNKKEYEVQFLYPSTIFVEKVFN